jgi:hypothetical protein
MKALVMSGVSSAIEITLPTTRAVPSIRTSQKPIHRSDKSNTLPQRNSNKHCTPSLESITTKSQSTIPAILPHKILSTSPISPNSLLAISTTKNPYMKTLIEQLGTMLNLLNTVLSKLP